MVETNQSDCNLMLSLRNSRASTICSCKQGCSGPIRFVVNEGELVGAVIDIALKSYARDGRYLFLDRILMSFFFIPLVLDQMEVH
ncbi:hypothetical protein PVK06_013341 [Gossypium arboreum]|uniref:DUF7054 domain-containing protein n=1 Tax=Gossypium arboreum TaxID=29729 RepID=A0ABR0QEQ2_GOSAR|nr:hypothetical protein PVK06_013341 [Gossypium arboreum]